MKLRHVRAVAVFGIVLVTLTGARGSHGGSCGGSSSGSSSSSSSSGGGTSTSGGYDGSTGATGSTDSTSGSTSGYGDSGYTSGYTTSGTSTSSSGSSSGSGSKAKPGDDKGVSITECFYDPSRGIVARVSAHNTSTSEQYTYKFQVRFTDPERNVLGTRDSMIPWVQPGKLEKTDVATPYWAKDGDGSGGSCELVSVSRTTL
ncbi:hypothetical protein AB0A69_12075 [Streptomyces sp. NPDC045431]|uniref:hypothetical protein n=1 Tax=Streptomyces sp. NPDC045431 TaxID=3155613 RepID=UPI0033C75BB5